MPDGITSTQFQKNLKAFLAQGMSLASPVDQMAPGKFPLLVNVRINKIGQIDMRGGFLPLFGPIFAAIALASPGFEAGGVLGNANSGWFQQVLLGATGPFAYDTGTFNSGLASAKVTKNNGGLNFNSIQNNVVTPCAPGDQVYVQFFAKNDGSSILFGGLRWFDQNGLTLAVSRPLDTGINGGGAPTWTVYQGLYTAPANAVSYGFEVGVTSASPNGSGWFDDCAVIPGGGCHSIRRLNDDVPGALVASALLSGAGRTLFVNGLQADTGYSGNPLSLVPYRPEKSVESWMYIADSLRMRKAKSDGTNFQWGIAPPTAAPGVVFGPPNYLIFADCETTTGWVSSGSGLALSGLPRYPGATAAVISDGASGGVLSGWSSVRIATGWGAGFNPGADITIGGERTIIQQVLPAPDQIAISSVAYDSGVNGECTIHAQVIAKGIIPGITRATSEDILSEFDDALFTRGARSNPQNRIDRLQARRDAASEIQTLWTHAGYQANAWVDFYRDQTLSIFLGSAIVQSVTHGPDGTASIRLNSGNTQLFPGAVMVGRPSIRCFFQNAKVQAPATVTVSGNSVQAGMSPGWGYLTLATPFNLAQIPVTGGGVRPVQDSDEIHLSVLIADISKLQEVRLFLDVDATTNDFLHNYYYVAVRQNDLIAAAKSTATQTTAKQTVIQRDVIDASPARHSAVEFFPGMRGRQIIPRQPVIPRQPASQTATGDAQWTEIRVKVKDLQRVGGDGSRTLANVAAIRVQFTATVTVNIAIDSMWIGGTFGPDVGDIGIPYLYRGRYRSSATGAKSNLSPPLRSGLLLRRQAAVIVPTVPADPQVDRYDVYRYGGSLPQWTYIGSAIGYSKSNVSAGNSGGVPPTGLIQVAPPPSTGNAGWTALIGANVILSGFSDPIFNGNWTIAQAGFNFFNVVIPGIAGHVATGGTVQVMSSFSDVYADDEIANLEQATFDDFQPFPDVDIPHGGICNVIGTRVIAVSGDPFNVNWWQGSEILINGVLYNLYAQPSTTATLEIVQNGGTQTGVAWEVPQATLIGQPLPVAWGPTPDTNFIFACGSKLQPGVLFWTNGNDADSASDINQKEISPPTEPLLNGGLYDGRAFVASSERFWVLYPNFDPSGQTDTTSPWQEMEVPVGRGLFTRWGMCIGKKGVYFIGKDGIYRTQFGQAESITDADMYPLFPHAGQPGSPTTLAGFTVTPPDFAGNPTSLRLSGSDGLVYFDFADTTGNHATLVFDERTDGWVSYDVNHPGFAVHYDSEGRGQHATYAGGIDGSIYVASGSFDQLQNGLSLEIAAKVAIPADDGGNVRVRKKWKEVFLQAGITGAAHGLTVQSYNGLYQGILQTDTILLATGIGAQSNNYFVVDLGTGEGRVGRTFGCLISWSEKVPISLVRYGIYFDEQIEETFLRITPYDDCGYTGAKFIQGVVLDASTAGQNDATNDTNGAVVLVDVLDDARAVQAVLSCQHNGRQEIAYSFAPFISHMVRLSPEDPTLHIAMYRARWIFEPVPEAVTLYQTQSTTHDFEDYHHVGGVLLSLMSVDNVTLAVVDDVAGFSYVFPSTNGIPRKLYQRVRARKSKYFQYILSSPSPFRLFLKDSSVLVKGWGDNGPYQVKTPFGDVSRIMGAQI